MLKEQDHQRILALNDVISIDLQIVIHLIQAFSLLTLHDLSLLVPLDQCFLSELVNHILLAQGVISEVALDFPREMLSTQLVQLEDSHEVLDLHIVILLK